MYARHSYHVTYVIAVIIKKNMQAIQEVPRAKGICIGLTLYAGEFKALQMQLQDDTSPLKVRYSLPLFSSTLYSLIFLYTHHVPI
jgi:hypothetical protein